jgi:hypothetical protein
VENRAPPLPSPAVREPRAGRHAAPPGHDPDAAAAGYDRDAAEADYDGHAARLGHDRDAVDAGYGYDRHAAEVRRQRAARGPRAVERRGEDQRHQHRALTGYRTLAHCSTLQGGGV